MKKLQSLYSIALGLILLGLVFGLMPVYQGAAATQDEIVEYQFYRNTAIGEDACTTAVNARINSLAQVQLVITMPTENSTGFSLEHSNDGTNWADGADLATAVTTDTEVFTEVANMGVFTRICANVTGADTLTVTGRTVFKP